MNLPQHTTITITRAEINDVLVRRWDYVSKAERMAIHRKRIARLREERAQRQEQRR